MPAQHIETIVLYVKEDYTEGWHMVLAKINTMSETTLSLHQVLIERNSSNSELTFT